MTTRAQQIDSLLIGHDPVLQRAKEVIEKIGPSNIAVLIEGESGTGKELAAEALHSVGSRRGAFVPANVCAIADSMFEDAFFGHVRGAFTGADGASQGFLQEADGGTIFLDEIAGLPVRHQIKLLRAIETGSFRALGAASDSRSRFRIISASNEPLPALLQRGELRRDLVHRLAGIVLRLPPLRERGADIELLAQRFAMAQTHSSGEPCLVSATALTRLRAHHWPGNIRELRQLIESAAILSPEREIGRSIVEELLFSYSRRVPHSFQQTRAAEERVLLVAALAAAEGDARRAAGMLGASRATVYRLARSHGLLLNDFRVDARVEARSSESAGA